MEWCEKHHGLRPVEVVEKAGLLRKGLICAHCLYVSESDIEKMAAAEVCVAHNARSNAKAGRGIAPVEAMRKAGIPVGIATDGPMSGNTLDLFSQFGPVSMFQKLLGHSRKPMPAVEVIRMATIEGARVLGLDARIGSLSRQAGRSRPHRPVGARAAAGLRHLCHAGILGDAGGRPRRDGRRAAGSSAAARSRPWSARRFCATRCRSPPRSRPRCRASTLPHPRLDRCKRAEPIMLSWAFQDATRGVAAADTVSSPRLSVITLAACGLYSLDMATFAYANSNMMETADALLECPVSVAAEKRSAVTRIYP